MGDGMGKGLFRAALAMSLAAVAFTVTPVCAEDGWKPLADELKSANPGLSSKRKMAEALMISASARMAWEDPMVEAGLMGVPVDTLRFDREDMTQKTIGVSQMIPSLSKRVAQTRFAEAEASVANAEAVMAARGLLAELKKNVYEIHYLDEALETLSRNQTILDETIIISNAKYASGKGSQVSVIQAQLERTRLDEKRLAIAEKRGLVRVKINRLLNRDTGAEFTPPAGVIAEPDAPAFDGVWERAKVNSPMVKVASAELAKARTMVERERSETGLDMTFTAEYAQRDDTPMERPDLVSFRAAVKFPLWRTQKQDRYIASAAKDAESVSDRLTDALAKVRTEVEGAALSAVKETDTIKLYKTGILPQAEQALASARAAYQLDKVDFLTLLMTEQTLIEYELMAEEARMRLRSVLADLEFITGAGMDEGGAR
jgi:outer membrane protein TolC